MTISEVRKQIVALVLVGPLTMLAVESFVAQMPTKIRHHVPCDMAVRGKDDELEQAKKEILQLQQDYETLQSESMNQLIEHRSEIVDLKDSMRKQASYLNLQVDQLKEALHEANVVADKSIRNAWAVAEAREVKLRQERDAVTKERDEWQAQAQALYEECQAESTECENQLQQERRARAKLQLLLQFMSLNNEAATPIGH